MAERLVVDGDELTRFRRSLRGSVTSLGHTKKSLHRATAAGLGTGDLDGACDAFQSDWHYGTGRIGQQVRELSGIAEKGEKSYAEVDKALEQTLRGGAHAGGRR
jgi:hypothetical protein